MLRFRARLAVAAVAFTATSAPAIDLGLGLFKRKPTPSAPTAPPTKPDPAARLKQLVTAIQSDPDLDRRKAAVEELKAADLKFAQEALPTLLGAIQKDPSPAVRIVLAETIGGLKLPATAASVLETVEKTDPDSSVRAAARSALWQVQANASRPTSTAPGKGSAGEPAFARPPATTRPSVISAPTPEPYARPITQGPGKGGLYKETPEPTFARPRANTSTSAKTVEPTIPTIPALPEPAPLPLPQPRELPTLPVPTPKPGDLPPLTIPVAPTVIVAPPPGTGTPTILPPGSGR